MFHYSKFSDGLRNGNRNLSTPNLPKVPKAGGRVTNGRTLGSLAILGGSDVKLAGASVAPESEIVSVQSAPFARCPGYRLPSSVRRGRVEQIGGAFLHFCAECGAWGAYGYGVNLRAGHLGRWFCAEHRPPQPKIR
jgi:hypothetical protein